MSAPISVDLPHRLGAVEAKRRIAANIGSLTSHLPGGSQVRSHWQGDTLKLALNVIGQDASADIEVRETLLRLTVMLPPALAFFGKAIEAALRRTGPELLEDRAAKR